MLEEQTLALRVPIDPRQQIDKLVREVSRFGLPQNGHRDDRTLQAREQLKDLVGSKLTRQGIAQLDPDQAIGVRHELTRLCVAGQLQLFLGLSEISHPVYNYFAPFEDNVQGPWDRELLFPQIFTPVAWSLLGTPVRFPIGVPASGLTGNAEWVGYYARRGFNIITYKTVRSRPFAAHLFPNWVFLNGIDKPWQTLKEVEPVLGDLDTWPIRSDRASTANSFGVPSPEPEIWQADVQKSLDRLIQGQLLIVSVMGSSEAFKGQALVKDFVEVARLAEEAGAPAIELNLSCPNTVSEAERGMSPPICENAETTREIVDAVRSGLRKDSTKLVIKLSYLKMDTLRAVLSLVGNTIDGVSGINTVPAEVRTPSGDFLFVGTGKDPMRVRERAGVSGYAIRHLGMKFVQRVNEIRESNGFKFDLLGMGGVMAAGDVAWLMEGGADAVQTATAAYCNPMLPLDLLRDDVIRGKVWAAAHGEPAGTGLASEQRGPNLLTKIGDLLASGGLNLVFKDKHRSK